jgi:mannose-6-phosphate isomerase
LLRPQESKVKGIGLRSSATTAELSKKDAIAKRRVTGARHLSPAEEVDMSRDVQTPTEVRPWGSYFVIDEGLGFKVKRIVVKPGGRLSLQSHKYRAEHWTVINGEATVTIGETIRQLGRGESADIPNGSIHRLENFDTVDIELIEVQFGHHLNEDDIVRYQDVYERVSKDMAALD